MTGVRSGRAPARKGKKGGEAMRGRKPTEVKKLEGNPAKRPLNEAEPSPKPNLPRAPQHMGPEGRRE